MANTPSTPLARRSMLKATFGALAGGTALLAARQAAACAAATPAQTEGPFFPVTAQADQDWDLTVIPGRRAAPLGEAVYVLGQVTNEQCRPVAGVSVEIWQACASGRYNHPGDTSGLPLDPNFQYWGIAITDATGNYKFKTILPGDYPADDTWQRPPHIHFKLHKRGLHELTTQMYFAGNPLNDDDLILRNVPEDQRASVVIEIADANPTAGLDLRSCRFDLGMRRV